MAKKMSRLARSGSFGAVSSVSSSSSTGAVRRFHRPEPGPKQQRLRLLWRSAFGAYLASGQLALLSAGVDLRGSFANNSGNTFDSYSIGPRISLNTHILPIHPYVEATAGVGRLSLGGGIIGLRD